MKILRILVNVAIVCIILMIAVCFPNIVSSYLQKSLEDKVSYVDVGVKTYEVKYNNIWEKLVTIQKCVEEEGKLKTIPIVTEVTEELKENLTQKVMQQLNKIQDGISYEFSEIYKEELVTCDNYAIYSSNEAIGISFWKLEYQRKKEDIQIIMDTEFNYIYVFRLNLKPQYARQVLKKCCNSSDELLLDLWSHNISDYFDMESNKNIDTILPNISNNIDLNKNISYNPNLLLYCNLFYLDEKDDIFDKDTNNISSNSSTIYKQYDEIDSEIIVDEKEKKTKESRIVIYLCCNYEWNEDGLLLIWGFPFFYYMMQL